MGAVDSLPGDVGYLLSCWKSATRSLVASASRQPQGWRHDGSLRPRRNVVKQAGKEEGTADRNCYQQGSISKEIMHLGLLRLVWEWNIADKKQGCTLEKPDKDSRDDLFP